MSDFKPKGIQSLVPYVYVQGIPEYLEFVRAAFGIEIITETKNDDGVTFYATLRFDDTVFFAQEPEGDIGLSSALYLYVPNLRAAYERALEAGAISIAEPAEQYHGDSLAILKDRWGNHWFLAYSTAILDDDQVQEQRRRAGK